MDKSEQIRTRAHQIWESEGCPEGREAEHWARAQDELREEGALADDDAFADGYQNDTLSAPVTDVAAEDTSSADGRVIEAGEDGTAGRPDEADEAIESPVHGNEQGAE
ncbi:MAG: DUF2934 domain-containing protein [Alphaproteobacteria bacterium]|nr:DUF2934 domain-containing protein [Alphaproteobacteria bacterium]